MIDQAFMLANRFDRNALIPQQPMNTTATPFNRELFGADMEHLHKPLCHRAELVQLMAERYMRADAALATWAGPAMECVDFVEGRQYTAAELAKADAEGRPAYTFNKVAPLVRLVLGYHRNNRMDTRYLPDDDGASTEAVANQLTKLRKHVSNRNMEPFVDAEMFLDGMLTGRGYKDFRLDFEKNDLGELKITAKDPFTIRIDPDADTYDPKHWNYIQEARWWSIDEIEHSFGMNAAALVWPLIGSSSYKGGVGTYGSGVFDVNAEIAPWRTFGGRELYGEMFNMDAYMANVVDTARKNVRVIDTQWMIRVMQKCVLNLETGDREPLPDRFTDADTNKLMQWGAEQYALKGEAFPLRIEYRPMRRVRWTVMVGDLIVYDDWSPYESYTIIPFFPWFRRGKTRGMIEDLIGPQKEINRRRSATIDIVERTAHSGWMWHERGLRETEKIKMEKYGASAGINIEWKGDATMKPEKIVPGAPPTAMERLEEKATGDLKEIAGINDSALGQIDRVQSGRAIEARQKQSVLGIETYMDNGRRTKWLEAEKSLEIFQNHYTEKRIFRMAAGSGKFETLSINERAASGEIVNNVTIGKYGISIDDTPLAASYMSAQYEELIELAEKGLLPIPMIQDIAIELSSLPQKELLKMRMNALLKAQGMLTADELVALMQQGIIPDPSQIPQVAPAPGKGGAAQPGQPGGQEKGDVTGGGAPPPAKPTAPPPNEGMTSPQGMYQ